MAMNDRDRLNELHTHHLEKYRAAVRIAGTAQGNVTRALRDLKVYEEAIRDLDES